MKLVLALVALIFLMMASVANAQMQSMLTEGGILIVELTTISDVTVPENIIFAINFVNPTTQKTQVHIDYSMEVTMNDQMFGRAESHTTEGKVKIPLILKDAGVYTVNVTVSGIFFNPITPQSAIFTVNVGQEDLSTSIPDNNPATPDNGGGCLIATAAYGTEMASQVQLLRELRDNTLLTTNSGTSFMSIFNDVYYIFSPTVADLERQSPEFKVMVRTLITPMITSLSILSLADAGSDSDALGLGLAVIGLNLGIYAGVPILAIFGVRKLYLR